MSSGVYRIVNSISGSFYVGSSINIELRWKEHLKMLRKGNHHSPYFQFSWNKYGEAAFQFEIIQETSTFKDDIIAAEQKALDEANPKLLMNALLTAYSNLGSKSSEETKRKIAAAGRRISSTPEGRAHLLRMAELAALSPLRTTEGIAKESRTEEGRKRRSENARRLWAEGKMCKGGSAEMQRRSLSRRWFKQKDTTCAPNV